MIFGLIIHSVIESNLKPVKDGLSNLFLNKFDQINFQANNFELLGRMINVGMKLYNYGFKVRSPSARKINFELLNI